MSTRKRVVVLTGAGISAESGISTFRDSGGLWEGHDVMEVASPQGWHRDPELVLNFYNLRRRNVLEVEPNAGHTALAELEQHFDVQIVTQNVDDLHERAGSTNILHLHGELLKCRSTGYEHLVYDRTDDIVLGDVCERGFQLRPHIVWFGEAVPAMEEAIAIAQTADIFLVVGTSLVVYPAASLLQFVPNGKPIYLIDPNRPDVRLGGNLQFIEEKASIGVPLLVKELIEQHG